MQKVNNNFKLLMATLSTIIVAHQGKASVTYFDYEAADSGINIKDIELSSGNKMFALKTADGQLGNAKYPVWVGNSDNLGAAFSSSWMTNATPSCAFFKDKLYIAPKGQKNYLYRLDVGNGQMPNVKSADLVKFKSDGTLMMQSPYLYATTNNLYAIENSSDGQIRVRSFREGDDESLQRVNSVLSNSSKSIQKEQIKDIVSKTINGQDYLYILTTNGTQTADLWLFGNSGGQCITPPEWTEKNNDLGFWEVTPCFDHTTSIAIHGDKLLSANANLDADSMQFGFMSQINSDGTLGATESYLPSDTLRVSAIGSDQHIYYAEAINDDRTPVDKTFDKYFIKAVPKDVKNHWMESKYYSDQTHNHQGEAVYKFTTRKEGEIFAISPNRIYRIKSN